MNGPIRRRIQRPMRLGQWLLPLLALPAAALAHHSSPAVYDLERTVEVTGELVDVAWRNPHVKLTLRVPDANGEATLWTLEANAPSMLEERGITQDRDVITYCHTHHRSAHTYVMLRHLGFDSVKGYAGSWSEWGNDPETPVES